MPNLELVVCNSIFKGYPPLQVLKAYVMWKTISKKDLVSFSLQANGSHASEFCPQSGILTCVCLSGKGKQMTGGFTETTHNMIVTGVNHFNSPLLHLWKQIHLKATLDILSNTRIAHALLVKTN